MMLGLPGKLICSAPGRTGAGHGGLLCCGIHIQEQKGSFSSRLHQTPQLILPWLMPALTEAAFPVNGIVNIKCRGGEWQL